MKKYFRILLNNNTAMNLNNLKFFLILVFALSAALAAQEKESPTDRSQEIIKKAQKKIGKKTDLNLLKTLTVNYESSSRTVFQNKIFETDTKSRVSMDGLDKFYGVKSIKHFSNGKQSNTEEQRYVLNGEQFSFETDVFAVDGTKIEFDVNKEVDKKLLKNNFKNEMFYLIFPLTLDSSLYFPMNSKYIGIVESKDGKAEVVEMQTPSKRIFRLFFDPNTDLLLMMSETWTNKDNQTFENKYFYSDYIEKSGLLFASKIVVEKKGTVIEEKTIKQIEVNPVLNSKLFNVK